MGFFSKAGLVMNSDCSTLLCLPTKVANWCVFLLKTVKVYSQFHWHRLKLIHITIPAFFLLSSCRQNSLLVLIKFVSLEYYNHSNKISIVNSIFSFGRWVPTYSRKAAGIHRELKKLLLEKTSCLCVLVLLLTVATCNSCGRIPLNF